MKTNIELNGKDSKIVSFSEFEKILNSVEMNWYGVKNWNGSDIRLFEEKYDGFTCEPVKNGMKIWNRIFDYSSLYEN